MFDSADGRPHGSSVEGAWFSSSPRASSRRAPFTFGFGETFERKRAHRRNRRERGRVSKPIAFSPTLSFASVSAASVLNVISARRYRVASKAPCARLRSHAASRSASAPSHSSSIKSHIAPRPRGKRRENRNEESGEERNSSQERKQTRVRREERDSSPEREKRLESGEERDSTRLESEASPPLRLRSCDPSRASSARMVTSPTARARDASDSTSTYRRYGCGITGRREESPTQGFWGASPRPGEKRKTEPNRVASRRRKKKPTRTARGKRRRRVSLEASRRASRAAD